jgi:hypothetical protein
MTRGRVGVLRLLTALLGVLLGTACGDSPTSPSSSTSTTFLSLVSSPGDLLGNGFTQRVGLSEAVFFARVLQLAYNRQAQFELRHPADIPTQQVVDISVEPPRGVRSEWSHRLLFALPVGQPLRPGTFEGATLWPGDVDHPGIRLTVNGWECTSLTGRFVITELVLGQGSTPDRLHMTFEQRCLGATAPIRGEVSIVANPWR